MVAVIRTSESLSHSLNDNEKNVQRKIIKLIDEVNF